MSTVNAVSHQESLDQFDNIEYLIPEQVELQREAGGLASLTMGEQVYPKVDLYCTFPFTLPFKLISVRNGKGDEIGMIRDVAEFDGKTQKVIKDELQWRYFSPQITKIVSMKEEFGHTYWEVETDRGNRKFVTRGRDEGFHPLTDERIFMIDMTGNRFEIPELSKLDSKSRGILETIL